MTLVEELVGALEIAYWRVHLLEAHGYDYGLFGRCISPVCTQAENAIQRVRDEVGHAPDCWTRQGRGCTCSVPPIEITKQRAEWIAWLFPSGNPAMTPSPSAAGGSKPESSSPVSR